MIYKVSNRVIPNFGQKKNAVNSIEVFGEFDLEDARFDVKDVQSDFKSVKLG